MAYTHKIVFPDESCIILGNSKFDPDRSAPINYSQTIVAAGVGGFGFFDLEKNKFTDLPTDGKTINLFDVYSDETIFWVDESTSTIRLFPKDYVRIRYNETWKPRAIAADFVNEKLYLIESRSRTLKVLDVYAKYHRTIATDLVDAIDLAVDPTSGFLFIVEYAKCVSSCRRDF